MANWYGAARTNYFKVKDEAAFKVWAEKRGCEVHDKDGRFCLLPGDYTDDGVFSNYDCDADEEIDIMGELSDFLADGSIAVLMQTGAEKLCYLTGFSEAIDNEGNMVAVSIDDIYALAAKEWPGEEVTRCEY